MYMVWHYFHLFDDYLVVLRCLSQNFFHFINKLFSDEGLVTILSYPD